ncbi:hypothetical protein ACPPVU_04195 [Mucilaginibacter sp. McL0603]|uniref:hypothetical protein n=1 Tax=Mucilaginibacter sp. McL0603 TaxID=3415670 RepID=UPI003CF5E396
MKYIPFLILLLSLTACFNSSEDKPRLLYRQRIANSSYVIYEFTYPGSFVTSSDFSGLTVLDSNDVFSRNNIKPLPCYYFENKPTGKQLKMIDITDGPNPSTAKDTLLVPEKKYSITNSGFIINVTEYKQTYGSAISTTGLMEYSFDGFKETKDSLVFYQVKKKFGGKDFSGMVPFLKGNIKIIESAGKQIDHIEIDQAIITRGPIYKPTKPLELVANQPIVGFATYYFYPNKNISSAQLTDFGIYKQIE